MGPNRSGTPLLRNETKSKDPPFPSEGDRPPFGWQYANSVPWQPWKDDPSLKITPGAMTRICRKVNVEPSGAAAERYPSLNGEYVMTDRWYCGRPVYQNDFGQLLYQQDDTTNTGWAIGPNIGDPNIRGLKARNCPADETSWTFLNGISSWPVAKITITCNKSCCEAQEVNESEWCPVEVDSAEEDSTYN